MQQGPPCHPFGCSGFGNENAQVMFIQTSPSKQDFNSGIPLSTGNGAKLFNECLRAIGIDRDDVYVTNLVCTTGFTPEARNIIQCWPRLCEEISQVKPKLIVTFDDLAASAFNPEYKFGQVRGAVLWNERFHCYTLATYNPHSIYTGFVDHIHDILRDFDKIQRVLVWKDKVGLSEITWSIAPSREVAQEWLNCLPDNTLMAVDIETNQGKDADGNLDVFNDRLLTVCVATTEEALVISESCAHDLDWNINRLRFGYHYGVFDTQGIRRFLGVQLPIHEDSMLMSHSLDERTGLHGLKSIAREYLGCGFYEQQLSSETKSYRKAKSTMAEVPWEKMCEYNAKDAVYTARLIKYFTQKQIEDNVRTHYETVTIPAANMFSEVEFRGIPIDQNALEELGLNWFPRYLKMQEELVDDAQALGFPGKINIGSPKQLSHLLYTILKLPGGPSTNKDTLEALRDFHPFVSKLMAYRDLDTLISHYHLGIMDDIKMDGAVHPRVMLHGTVTHRLSYHEPPLQTIKKPRQGETENSDVTLLRTIFSPANKDHVFVEVDYEQAELYAAAFIAQDKQLYEDLCSEDFHRLSAAAQRGIEIEDVTDDMRRDGKPITFGNMYGLGNEKAAKQIKETIENVKKFKEGFYKRYLQFKKWRDNVKTILENEGEIQSPTGWKRRTRLMVGDKAYHYWQQGVNTPIQNLASDTTLRAATRLHTILKEYDSYILFLVHDAIYFELNKNYLEETLPLIKRVMQEPQFEGAYPDPVEIKIGPNWAAVKKVKVS